MTLRALLFDVDGTLADTEELHRRAFNAAFRGAGLDWSWNPDTYRALLEVTGGKERLAHWLDSLALRPRERERLARRIPEIHADKTRAFALQLEGGAIRLRTGIARLVREAHAAGLRLAIASTTTAANVGAILARGFGEGGAALFDVIATGDVVPSKKPAPDIYHLVLRRLALPPQDCVAFEDSEAGVVAAAAAGVPTVAVPGTWTRHHDLRAASLVIDSLGDPDEPLGPEDAARLGGAHWLRLEHLEALLRGANPPAPSRATAVIPPDLSPESPPC